MASRFFGSYRNSHPSKRGTDLNGKPTGPRGVAAQDKIKKRKEAEARNALTLECKRRATARVRGFRRHSECAAFEKRVSMVRDQAKANNTSR